MLNSESESNTRNICPLQNLTSAYSHRGCTELKVKQFDLLLSQTTDTTLSQVFGASSTDLIYSFMERHASLKRDAISEKIEVFYTYLDKLLGSERAQIIQAASLKCLCRRLRREYEEIEQYFSLLDELYEIKFKLSSQSWNAERPTGN